MIIKGLRLVNRILGLFTFFLDMIYIIFDIQIVIFLTQLSEIFKVGQKISDLFVVNFKVAHTYRIGALILSLKHLKE